MRMAKMYNRLMFSQDTLESPKNIDQVKEFNLTETVNSKNNSPLRLAPIIEKESMLSHNTTLNSVIEL
jgi:hypothetical protein